MFQFTYIDQVFSRVLLVLVKLLHQSRWGKVFTILKISQMLDCLRYYIFFILSVATGWYFRLSTHRPRVKRWASGCSMECLLRGRVGWTAEVGRLVSPSLMLARLLSGEPTGQSRFSSQFSVSHHTRHHSSCVRRACQRPSVWRTGSPRGLQLRKPDQSEVRRL